VFAKIVSALGGRSQHAKRPHTGGQVARATRNLAACGVKWRGELREPAHRTFARRRRAPPHIKTGVKCCVKHDHSTRLRPPCDPQIVLSFILVLALVLFIFDYEEEDDLAASASSAVKKKTVKNKRSVDAFPVFRLQTVPHTQIQTPLHYRL